MTRRPFGIVYCSNGMLMAALFVRRFRLPRVGGRDGERRDGERRQDGCSRVGSHTGSL